ncbi:MAG: branched chain amino acid aminotransferase, partial [Deltaproteobacteria bacterium]
MEIIRQIVPQEHRKAKPDQKALGFGKYFTDHMLTMTYQERKGWHDLTIGPYADFSFDPAAMVLH